MSRLSAALAAVLLLSACGQSGALYLPDRDDGKKTGHKPVTSSAPAPTAEAPPAAPDAAAPSP